MKCILGIYLYVSERTLIDHEEMESRWVHSLKIREED